MTCPADKRVQLFDVPASGKQDVEAAVSSETRCGSRWPGRRRGSRTASTWFKNVSRILAHYTEEFLHEIRQQIPKDQAGGGEGLPSRPSAPAIT